MASRDFEVLEVTEEAILDVASRMRPEDVAEVRDCWGMTPEVCLRDSLWHSDEAGVLVIAGEAAGICGHAATSGGHGTAWWLTTDTVERHKKTYMRACRFAAGALLEKYESVTAWPDARYGRALRWLDALGFDIQAPRPIGHGGALVCPAILGRQ